MERFTLSMDCFKVEGDNARWGVFGINPYDNNFSLNLKFNENNKLKYLMSFLLKKYQKSL